MMEQALNDPAYQAQIELMQKMKKRGIIADDKKPKDEETQEDKTQQFAEKLLGGE